MRTSLEGSLEVFQRVVYFLPSHRLSPLRSGAQLNFFLHRRTGTTFPNVRSGISHAAHAAASTRRRVHPLRMLLVSSPPPLRRHFHFHRAQVPAVLCCWAHVPSLAVVSWACSAQIIVLALFNRFSNFQCPLIGVHSGLIADSGVLMWAPILETSNSSLCLLLYPILLPARPMVISLRPVTSIPRRGSYPGVKNTLLPSDCVEETY